MGVGFAHALTRYLGPAQSLSLAPSGADTGGTDRLWSAQRSAAPPANDDDETSGRLDAEVGYDVAGSWRIGIATSCGGARSRAADAGRRRRRGGEALCRHSPCPTPWRIRRHRQERGREASESDYSSSSIPATTSIARFHSRVIIVLTSSLNSRCSENHDLFMFKMSAT